MKSEEGLARRPEGESQFAIAEIADRRQSRRLFRWLTVAMLLLLLCSVVSVFSMGSGRAVANWLSPSGRRAKPSSHFTLHSSLKADSDSVVKTRWRIQPTVPLTVSDLDTSALDLRRPDNLVQTVELDTTSSSYRIDRKSVV